MEPAKTKFLAYKRSHFATQLPVHYLYSPSHCWIGQVEEGLWSVGLTRFATRMLGEMVDYGFEVETAAALQPGQIIGWVEGFKAISDVYCIAQGELHSINPALKEKISLISKDCYGAGWLYMVRGKPDSTCIDAEAYRALLDKTIDKILEKQKTD